MSQPPKVARPAPESTNGSNPGPLGARPLPQGPAKPAERANCGPDPAHPRPEGETRRALAVRPSGDSDRDLARALSLERAGDLEAAASLLEAAGEAERAAALRLELAGTLRDSHQRLAVLREAVARLRGYGGEDAQALHSALADALEIEIEAGELGPRRRRLEMERARALALAGRGDEAGKIYETLGQLPRAAKAYLSVGALEEYEFVEAALSAQAEDRKSRRNLDREFAVLEREGRRHEAKLLLESELTRLSQERLGGGDPRQQIAHELGNATPHSSPQNQQQIRHLRARLAQLEQQSLAPGRLTLRYAEVPDEGLNPALKPEHQLRIHLDRSLRIGRSPGLELSVDAPGLSRHHATLGRQVGDDGSDLITLIDHNSREGTYWEGEAIDPDTEYELGPGPHTIGLGSGVDLELEISDRGALHLSRGHGSAHQDLALPALDGQISLGQLPETHPLRDALRLHEINGQLLLSCSDPEVTMYLGDEWITRSAGVELLVDDRIRCMHPRYHTLYLEVAR